MLLQRIGKQQYNFLKEETFAVCCQFREIIHNWLSMKVNFPAKNIIRSHPQKLIPVKLIEAQIVFTIIIKFDNLRIWRMKIVLLIHTSLIYS